MASNSETPYVLVLESPDCGYNHAEIMTVIRNKIMLYDNAPHGYYIASDSQGNQYLFHFVIGKDSMKAYHEALGAKDVPKLSKPRPSVITQSNPLPMRTGGQQSRSGNLTFSYLPQMQSSRMAGPEYAYPNAAKSVSQYIQQYDKNSLLPLQEIDIRSSVSTRARKTFYFLRADVNDTTPKLNGLKFQLPIDTVIASSWLFIENFKFIKSAQLDDQEIEADIENEWPSNFNQDSDEVQWPFTVKRPFMFDNIPGRVVQYGSNGYVYMHDGPVDSKISVTLHGWDWERQDDSKTGFKIYDGFDFVSASNMRIISDGYDGNIGLGPRQGDLQTETSRSFLASLTATRHIRDASVFIIRLVHPDILDHIPLSCVLYEPFFQLLLNIISFGPEFPLQAPVNPDAEFSSPIPVVSVAANNSIRPRKWEVRLLRISISSSDNSDYSWIDMDDPEESLRSSIKGINILMDTGTPMTVFPSYVLSKMQSDERWLGPSMHKDNKIFLSDSRFERLLREKIRFEFQGEGRHTVGLVLQAKAFMSWYSKAAAGDDPTSHLCAIKGSKANFALGQNWYWAAIVKHVSPRERRKYPFVQVMPNGYFFDRETRKPVKPTDMILKTLPPRLA
ncbi:hypothetical protein F5050DRAFT_1824005 [Lentinula boryana]|uniref:Peptidase A1 domain-containing protein n=1 Tax=Lentinula boryana TaxID=40481 RepID=A0ABQ8QBC0_9AGAR|nr:hypothetical protein F5050DRAFT_1824005 [Lentinula boryana]